MKPRELTILSSVVAAIAATTWFVQSPDDITHVPTVNVVNEAPIVSVVKPIVSVVKDVTRDLETPEADPYLVMHKQSSQSASQLDNISESQSSSSPFNDRIQAIESIYDQFSILETQYGVLSIDDIAVLQDSLVEIDEQEMLADLSYALDELITQP